MNKEKRIVMVCPLNWGLGHASRCIPIIRKLQLAGFKVIAAAEGRALALLKEECTDINYVTLPGFSPHFSAGKYLFFKFPGWFISIIWHTFNEHRIIKRMIDYHKVDVVISDNRFGLFTKKAKCIFITHQIMFKTPQYFGFAEPFLYRINRFFIQKYDSCWIPDLPGIENLSGDMSHKYPLPGNAHFIGLLSRFQRHEFKEASVESPLLALLSGPEPQRSIFEKLVLKEFEKSNHPATIVRGTPAELMDIELHNNISGHNHMLTNDLAKVMHKAGVVICRSGYSTLMDLAVSEKKTVLLVPTPGQTEQEYLAERLKELGWMNYQPQNEFNLDNISSALTEYSGINLLIDETLLDEQIRTLLQDLNSLYSRH